MIELARLGLPISSHQPAIGFLRELHRYLLKRCCGRAFGDGINLVDNLGVSLVTTSIIFALLLATVFIAWYAVEKTLSVHTIFTVRRELFYWAAILFTFSLGTSGGDLLSERLGLGYPLSALLFAAGIAGVIAAHKFGMDGVLAFWIAYILTRPLGASIGDFLTQEKANGGLGLGTISVSLVFLVIIVGLIIHLTNQERKHPLQPVKT